MFMHYNQYTHKTKQAIDAERVTVLKDSQENNYEKKMIKKFNNKPTNKSNHKIKIK